MIPLIETDRLVLAPPVRGDFDALVRLRNLPEIYQYMGGKAWPKAQVWQVYLANLGAWSELGYGMWPVKRKDTGVIIGQVGFPFAMRDLGQGFDEYPEAAWLFERAAQGQGFAFEAMQAAFEWFDGTGISRTCVCMTDVRNAASMRLAQKLGFLKTRTAEFSGDTAQLFERKGLDV